MNKYEISRAVDLVEILYKRSSFHGFRRPVISMYPSLRNSYQETVKCPMDLGSLLLFLKFLQTDSCEEIEKKLIHVFPENFEFMTCLKGFSTDEFPFHMWLRKALSTIASNSIQFNGGSSQMEAISAHLQFSIETIFEAYFGKEEKDPLNENIRKYFLVENIPLSRSEFKQFVDILKRFPASPNLNVAIAVAVGELENYQNYNYKNKLTLAKLLQWNCDSSLTDKATELSGLSPLLILLEERMLRGINYSSIWARPGDRFIWARPIPTSSRDASNKPRINWFPAMVIAAGRGSSIVEDEQAGLTAELMTSNLSRLSQDLRNQLLKFRPRPVQKKEASGSEDTSSEPEADIATAVSVSDGSSFCPDGYLLVEFFGLHDFGWIRADTAGPLYLVEQKPANLPSLIASPQEKEITDSTLVKSDGSTSPAMSVVPSVLEDEPTCSQTPASEIVTEAAAVTISTGPLVVKQQDPRLSLPALKMFLNPPPTAPSRLCNKETLEEAKHALLWWIRHRRSLMTSAYSSNIESAVDDDMVLATIAALPAGHLPKEEEPDLEAVPTVEQLQESLQPSPDGEDVASDENYASFSSSTSSSAPQTAKRRKSNDGSIASGDAESSTTSSSKRRRSSPVHVAPTVIDATGRTLDESFLAGIEYNRCVEGSFLHVSRIPSLESVLHNALKTGWTLSARQSLCSIRNKAILATRVALTWMEKVRPLHLMDMSAISFGEFNSKRLEARAAVADITGRLVGNNCSSANRDSDGGRSKKAPEAFAVPSKRKYVFKNRQPATGGSSSVSAAVAAVAAMAGSNYLNVTPYVASVSFILDSEAGCSKFLCGDGVVYSRTVNESAPIFLREHPNREQRKKILREELQRIKNAVAALQESARKRELS